MSDISAILDASIDVDAHLVLATNINLFFPLYLISI
jgi:hypothetical protein